MKRKNDVLGQLNQTGIKKIKIEEAFDRNAYKEPIDDTSEESTYENDEDDFSIEEDDEYEYDSDDSEDEPDYTSEEIALLEQQAVESVGNNNLIYNPEAYDPNVPMPTPVADYFADAMSSNVITFSTPTNSPISPNSSFYNSASSAGSVSYVGLGAVQPTYLFSSFIE